MEFPLRRKQKQRKQNPSPEGTLVLLSASGNSVGLWCSSPPCSPGPSATGSAEGSVERPPLRDPRASRNVSIGGVPARSMRAASVKPTAHNRGSAACQAWAAPLRWHKGYLRSWMTGGRILLLLRIRLVLRERHATVTGQTRTVCLCPPGLPSSAPGPASSLATSAQLDCHLF